MKRNLPQREALSCELQGIQKEKHPFSQVHSACLVHVQRRKDSGLEAEAVAYGCILKDLLSADFILQAVHFKMK